MNYPPDDIYLGDGIGGTPANNIIRFTEGDCHLLAIELYDTCEDLELAVLNTGYYDEDTKHAFVIKDGEAIDIEGKTSIDHMINKWDAKEWKLVDKEFFKTSEEWVGNTRAFFIGTREILKDVAKDIKEKYIEEAVCE